MRRLVAYASTPSTAGGNLDTTLSALDGASGRLDPAFSAHALPITSWARAVYCNWRPPVVLASMASRCQNAEHPQQQPQAPQYQPVAAAAASSNHGSGDQGDSTRTKWAAVRGPCAAAHATAERIGWTLISHKKLVTDKGRTLELDKDSPAAVEKEVHQAVRRWRRANVAELFDATRQMVQPKNGATRAQRASSIDGFEEDFESLHRLKKLLSGRRITRPA